MTRWVATGYARGTAGGQDRARARPRVRSGVGQRPLRREGPPGYADAKKPDEERYGDLIIWYEMLDLAAEGQLPILFVTEDAKEDWWWIADGERIGPREEIVHEMWARAGHRST